MSRITVDNMKAHSPQYWADVNGIYLDSGKFRLSGLEFQDEIFLSRARRQCARKGRQLGFTQIYILKVIHAGIYRKIPLGCMYLFPTGDRVSDFSDSRFGPLIQANPGTIGAYMKGPDRTNLRRINGCPLYFRGARAGKKTEANELSLQGVKGTPVDMAVFDELDEMDQVMIQPVLDGMAMSNVKQEVYLGNPTIPDYGIDAKYQESDQRIWLIRCDYCGKHTCLEEEWPQSLKRIKKDGKWAVIRACRNCGREIFPRDGHWEAQKPENTEWMVGWWISQLNNVRVDVEDLLRRWEDPKLKKGQFYNLVLGLAYIGTEDRLTPPQILDLCDPLHPMEANHPGPCAAGIDVQGEKKGLHVVIGAKTGLRTHKFVYIGKAPNWDDLHPLMKRYNVKCAVVDENPETRDAKRFAKDSRFPVYLCRYKESQRKNPAYDSKEHLVSINRTEICDESHDLVADEKTQLILPARSEIIEDFAKQMCNIAKVLDEDPDTGNKEYTYRKLGQDDFRHSVNYYLLASRRVNVSREESRKARTKDAWAKDFEDDGYEPVSFMAM